MYHAMYTVYTIINVYIYIYIYSYTTQHMYIPWCWNLWVPGTFGFLEPLGSCPKPGRFDTKLARSRSPRSRSGLVSRLAAAFEDVGSASKLEVLWELLCGVWPSRGSGLSGSVSEVQSFRDRGVEWAVRGVCMSVPGAMMMKHVSELRSWEQGQRQVREQRQGVR